MFDIIKNVIQSGRYELADILKKIDTTWIQGDVTDDEKDTLVELARTNATPDMGYMKLEERVQSLEGAMSEASRVIFILQEQVERLGAEPIDPPEPSDDEYPDWHQPTGAHDAYYKDDKMTYTDGKKYICIAPDGYGVTYGPDMLPDMWQLVEE